MPLSLARVYTQRGSIIRDEETATSWQPSLDVMSDSELERFMLDREREVRRLRRDTARYRSTMTSASASGRMTRNAASSYPPRYR